MGSESINKQNQQDDFLCIHIAVWSQLYYRLQCTYIKPRMAAHTLQKDYVEAINAQTDFMADLGINVHFFWCRSANLFRTINEYDVKLW